MTSDNSKVIANAMQLKKTNKRKTTAQFIEEATSIHGSRYIYEMVDYVGSHIKVKILCRVHGIYEQRPYGHLGGMWWYRDWETDRKSVV